MSTDATAVADPPGRRASVDRVGDGLLGVELGLLALAFATVASFTRMFQGWDFLVRLAPGVLLAWGVPTALRRMRAPIAVVVPIQLLAGAVALSVQFAPGTHFVGLPTAATIESLGTGIERSFADFSELVAPVPATDGFLVVIAACMYVFTLFADTAAVRFRGPIQAVIPYAAVFLSVAVLARTSGRTTATVVVGAALVLYASAVQARNAAARRWVTGQRRRGTSALVATTALVATCAVVIGVTVGPLAVGDRAPVVDLRRIGRGPGPRTVVSPFVGIRSLLGERSDDLVFRVTADEPSYWRLTALEQFDESRQIWVSSSTYKAVRNDLSGSHPELGAGKRLRQEFDVTGLGGLWLPGAFAPMRIDADQPVSFDDGSSSIIRREDSDDPVHYLLDSWIPDVELARRTRGAGGEFGPVHLEVPELSGDVRRAISTATTAARTDFERMLALQNWFRSRFAYDESVDYAGEPDPLTAFLEQRRGFCQQFSSAFALMARALGLPSRVAVGFTPGDLVAEPGEAERYVVRGRHAHAWPEVHLAGIGWVPFEPTPQRGDPQGVAHTGVAPAQADAPVTSSSTTTTSTPDEGSERAPTELTTTTSVPGSEAGRPREAARSSGSRWPWLAGAVAAALVAATAVAARRRRRGRDDEATSPERAAVAGAWSAALDALGQRGLRPSPTDTPLELAARVARIVAAIEEERDAAGSDTDEPAAATAAAARRTLVEAFGALARIETEARYGPRPLSAEDSAAATAAAETVGATSASLPEQATGHSSSLRRRRSRARVPAPLK